MKKYFKIFTFILILPVLFNGTLQARSISGQIIYNGIHTGTIWIGAFYAPYRVENFQDYVVSSVTIPSPGAYSIPLYEDNTGYWVGAFMDVNGDGICNFDNGPIEPVVQDYYGPIDVSGGADVTGIDMTIYDPSTEPEAYARTLHFQSGNYAIHFQLIPRQASVSTVTVSGPYVSPSLMQWDESDNCFYYYADLSLNRPQVGATYYFHLTLSDDTTQTVTTTIVGILDVFAEQVQPASDEIIYTTTPTFVWNSTSPVAQYGIEVIRVSGPMVWRKDNIPSTQTSIDYNSDGTGQPLEYGKSYQWRLIMIDNYWNGAFNDYKTFTIAQEGEGFGAVSGTVYNMTNSSGNLIIAIGEGSPGPEWNIVNATFTVIGKGESKNFTFNNVPAGNDWGLAAVLDANNDGNYNPDTGDPVGVTYPVTVLANQTTVADIYLSLQGNGPVSHFVFDTISSPQLKDTTFYVKITAINVNQSVAYDFNSQCTLKTNKGNIVIPSNIKFLAGVWEGEVSINTGPLADVKLICEYNGATGVVYGESNKFNVSDGIERSISGTVHYEGTQTGKIWIGAFKGTYYVQNWSDYAVSFTTLSAPGNFKINVLENANNYYVAGFIDLNDNGTCDWGLEPSATDYTGPFIINNNEITGADFTIIDPSTGPVTKIITKHWENGNYRITFYHDPKGLPVSTVTVNGQYADNLVLDSGGSVFYKEIYITSAPVKGAEYTFTRTFADNSTDSIKGYITNVIDDFGNQVYPQDNAKINTTIPTFTWEPVSQKYGLKIIVTDHIGMPTWEKSEIPWTVNSVKYNDDGTGSELQIGAFYKWKIELNDIDGNSSECNEYTFQVSTYGLGGFYGWLYNNSSTSAVMALMCGKGLPGENWQPVSISTYSMSAWSRVQYQIDKLYDATDYCIIGILDINNNGEYNPEEGDFAGGIINAKIENGENVNYDVYVNPYNGTDPIAPSAVNDLTAITGVQAGSIVLTWTAPGEDGNNGILKGTFKIQYSETPNTSWNPDNAQIVISTSDVIPGTKQTYIKTGLSGDTTYYFKLWTYDHINNRSGESNTASAKTQEYLPVISVDPISLEFGEIKIKEQKTLEIKITNTGGGTLSGTISSNREWLITDITEFTGNEVIVKITANNNILKQKKGDYEGSITITSNGGEVVVNARLTATCVLVMPNPLSLSSGKALVFYGNGVVENETKIKIFALSGELIKILEITDNNQIKWDCKDEKGEKIVPGIYIYTYESPKEKGTGKLTVIQ